MGIKCRFNAEKAIEVLLYIAHERPNVYTALKVLYFADKEHLAKYGCLICGDSYVAMRLGPVPSGAYDLIKNARGGGYCWADFPIPDEFIVDGNCIRPHRQANLDLLSESDVECLDIALQKYGHLSLGQLKALSHQEKPYKEADENDFIPLEAIARSFPEGEELLEYLRAD